MGWDQRQEDKRLDRHWTVNHIRIVQANARASKKSKMMIRVISCGMGMTGHHELQNTSQILLFRRAST